MTARAVLTGPERSRDEQFVGRGRELAVLHAQLGRAFESRSGLVVVEGPAGIGKTALVHEFLANVESALVLDVSGEESEAELPYGVLGQLGAQAQPVPEPLAQLPSMGEPEHPDPLVVGAALLDLLRQLQRVAPVVMVVDGGGWADLLSLQALTFALRRLRNDRVLTIVIVRDSDHSRLPDGLRRLLRGSSALRLPLGGLSVRELQTLSGRLGPVRLTPQAAERLHRHTKGVPLHVRALLQQVRPETLADVDAPLPAPRSYTALVRGRLAKCGKPAQRLVTAAAVLGTSAPLHLVARMAELDEPLPALEQAVAVGLLVEWRTGAGVSLGFRNPLVRAAVYDDLGPATRRRLHLLAADLVADVVHRLHHRLSAADRVDDELVGEVAEIGRSQAAAGLWSSACGCLARAVQLTQEGTGRDRLIAEAVEALVAAGRPGEAAALAAQVAPAADPGVRDYALGSVALVNGRLDEAGRHLDTAWPHAKTQCGLAAGVAGRQAMAALAGGRGADAVRWAEQADGDLVRFAELVGLGLAGRVEEGLARSGNLPAASQSDSGELDALLGRGMLRLWSDDLSGAHEDLAGVLAVGNGRSAAFQLLVETALAQVDYRLGRWDEAVMHAESGALAADDFGQLWLAAYAHAVAALVPAARGEWDRATAHVRAARAAGHPDNLIAQVSTASADGLAATARGDHEAVIAALTPLTRTHLPCEPAMVFWPGLLADALVNTGDPDEAENVLGPWERQAMDQERRSALAATARARAALQAARHASVEAESAFQTALEHSAKLDMPFEEARIQLAYGTFLRRRGRRAAAAEQLEAAQVTLSRLGALPYLEQCGLELAASGRSAPRARDTARLGLTPQEHTVAVLISRGLTNRQAARKLVLSVKTVEYHLSHIYTKLGITSRTALIGRLSDPRE
ncbi:AAA family ATPase [Nonomuraea sp. NPDC026600]|uniref:helix-turn-helix transcriptional regulator n=1 Tax=Nonomuraea sp. NPDC026600 TaxID=3155363 RepID=UPI003404B664